MDDFYNRYPQLLTCRDSIESAVKNLIDVFESGGKLLICGNGGSAADSEHIAGELLKGFLLDRKLACAEKERLKANNPNISERLLASLQMGLPAIPLVSFTAFSTAFANDAEPTLTFAQAVYALCNEGDALLCISTSGNSENCVSAAQIAKACGALVISLTGRDDSKLYEISDVTVHAPEVETYKIQEYHLPIYHKICVDLEHHFFR